MKKVLCAVLTTVLIAMTAVSLSSCGSEGEQVQSIAFLSSEEQTAEKPEPQQLREQIVGSWGRLGKTMHEFYSDNACIVGGMYGSYEINDECSLIMKTQGGTETEYVWNDMTKVDYWSLDGDILKVNGNQFERVPDETADEGYN